MTQELSRKWRQEEVYEALGIGKSTYYNRLSFLDIEPSKDSEGTYLTNEQMQEMEELSEHIRKTGKKEGFRGSGQLAVSESADLGLEIPELVEAEGGFLGVDDETLERIIHNAGELKVRQIAEPELVTLHLAAQMSEKDLSEQQRAQLQAIREAANPSSPKQNPVAIANQLLQRHRQNQNQSPNRQNP